MTQLSETERRLGRVMNQRVGWDGFDIAAVLAAQPGAFLVGEAPSATTSPECPMFPYPRFSAGWRLWKASGMELTDYLSSFHRTNVLDLPYWSVVQARERAKVIRDQAEREGLPLVLLGSRVADAFDHGAPLFTWDHVHQVVPIVCVPHPSGRNPAHVSEELRDATKAALREALEGGRWPPHQQRPDRAERCGVLTSAHRQHPRHPDLRIVCLRDLGQVSTDHRVVRPWGAS